MTVVESAISQVPGIVGVAAKHLKTGKELRHNADEVFFTGTSPCVLPCTEVDRRRVSDGKPGPIIAGAHVDTDSGFGKEREDAVLHAALGQTQPDRCHSNLQETKKPTFSGRLVQDACAHTYTTHSVVDS